jgi:Family of unknown function (DUF6452)
MKKILYALLFALLALSIWNCEKDDICEEGTPTTPRLIVEFYDNAVPSSKKSINDLKVTAQGQTNFLEFDATSKVELPLNINENTVVFQMNLNSKDAAIENTDNITINYTRNDIFISRACGYKSVFTLNDNPNGMTITPDSNNWIKEISIQKFVIDNENEIHVKIFY